MIACPKCDGPARTLETRTTSAGVRRRRECTKCGERLTTLEVLIAETSSSYRSEAIVVSRRAVERAIGSLQAALADAGVSKEPSE